MIVSSCQERCYKMKMGVDQLAVHFSMDGNMLHKESDEGRRQLARLGLVESGTGGEQNINEMEIPGEEELEGEGEVEEADAPKEIPAVKPPETALRNQFNYSERASQTFNNPYRVWTKHLLTVFF